MISGSNCLKFHCLRAWVEKYRADGPGAPVDGSAAMRRLAADRHAERIGRAEQQLEKMRSGT